MFQPVAIQSWVSAEAADIPPPTVAAKAAAVATTSEPRVPSSGRRRRMFRRAPGAAEHPDCDAAVAVMTYLRTLRRLFDVMTILRKFHGSAPEECGSYCPGNSPWSFWPAIPGLPGVIRQDRKSLCRWAERPSYGRYAGRRKNHPVNLPYADIKRKV